MALYYSIVFGLLVVEMAFFTLLSLPYPRAIRRRVLYTASAPFRNQNFQTATKCIMGFVAVLFIDSVNRVYSVSAELSGTLAAPGTTPTPAQAMLSERLEIQARRFYAQRNMYLCGFTLFLTLILTRTYSLVVELIATKDKLDVMVNEAPPADSDKILTLKEKLQSSDAEIELLKGKAKHLENDYDEVSQRKNVS